jgi:hypothetical protein
MSFFAEFAVSFDLKSGITLANAVAVSLQPGSLDPRDTSETMRLFPK